MLATPTVSMKKKKLTYVHRVIVLVRNIATLYAFLSLPITPLFYLLLAPLAWLVDLVVPPLAHLVDGLVLVIEVLVV